ncbi:glycerate kinase [Sporosarcina sp. P7]|uniref:glycerate kinase n=1 Tax=Sporosarcina sp. P7 TaxID=2048244 RepID=UPI000C16C906|nr:glycerate kinase [Sporosarcina sp. P7]PID25484.1 glycerate kinase [Sporosarcina sp. P7]
MKIVIAPDAFKGSLHAEEAADAIYSGVKKVYPHAEVVRLPVADGGEGTLSVLMSSTGGTLRTVSVQDPLGRAMDAHFGVLGDGETAVIEMAQASGLLLLADHELDPMKASTFGTGQLIRHALDAGYRKMIIGLGGSATNDGGTGLLEALGVRFLADEQVVQMNGSTLSIIDEIDISQLDKRLLETDIRIASDVENPFVGEQGASFVFGPQKGADAEMVLRLDEGLRHLADMTERQTGVRLHELRGAGAAGGSAGALLAYCGANLKSGIDVVLEAMDFAKQLSSADFIVTGEGKTDRQTLAGKALMGIAKLARVENVPVIVISGAIEEAARQELLEWFTELYSLDDGEKSLAELMAQAAKLLENKASIVLQHRQ